MPGTGQPMGGTLGRSLPTDEAREGSRVRKRLVSVLASPGIWTLALVVSLGVLFATAQADDKEAAKALVNSAANMVQTLGREKTLAELNNPTGKYAKGELYVFAYDLSGTMLAHPKNPKLVGKNLLELADVDGKLFRKEIVETAKSAGSGWVDYKYKNPETNKTEHKTTYLRKVNDIILCCGAYK